MASFDEMLRELRRREEKRRSQRAGQSTGFVVSPLAAGGDAVSKWEQMLQAAAAEAVASTGLTPLSAKPPEDSSVLGRVLNNPVTRTVLKPLEVLALPGRAVVSARKELGDLIDAVVSDPRFAKALPGQSERVVGELARTVLLPEEQFLRRIGSGVEHDDPSLRQLVSQARDPRFGFGSTIEPTGNKWADRFIGFGGDVAFDPLTYLTLGGTQVVNLPGRAATATRFLDDVMARAAAVSDDAARQAMMDEAADLARRYVQRGVSGISRSERELLGLRAPGLYVGLSPSRAVKVELPGVLGEKVDDVSELLQRAGAAARTGVSRRLNRTPGGSWVFRARTPEGLEVAWNKMMRGDTPEFLEGLSVHSLVTKAEAAKNDVLGRVPAEFNRKLAKMSEGDGRKALMDAEDGVLTPTSRMFVEAEAELRNRARALGPDGKPLMDVGFMVPEGVANYVPHYLTKEGREFLLGNMPQRDRVLLDELDPKGSFQAREWFVPAGETQKTFRIGDRDVVLRGNRLRDKEAAFREAFPEFKGEFFVHDFRRAHALYLEQMSRGIAVAETLSELAPKWWSQFGFAGDPKVSERVFDKDLFEAAVAGDVKRAVDKLGGELSAANELVLSTLDELRRIAKGVVGEADSGLEVLRGQVVEGRKAVTGLGADYRKLVAGARGDVEEFTNRVGRVADMLETAGVDQDTLEKLRSIAESVAGIGAGREQRVRNKMVLDKAARDLAEVSDEVAAQLTPDAVPQAVGLMGARGVLGRIVDEVVVRGGGLLDEIASVDLAVGEARGRIAGLSAERSAASRALRKFDEVAKRTEARLAAPKKLEFRQLRDDLGRLFKLAGEVDPDGVFHREVAALAELYAQEFESAPLSVKKLDEMFRDFRRTDPDVFKTVVRANFEMLGKHLKMSTPVFADPAVAEMFRRWEQAIGDKSWWRVAEEYVNFFKAWAVSSPGFVFRNAYSASFMQAVDGVSLRSVRDGLSDWRRLVKNPNGFIRGLPEGRVDEVDAAFRAVMGSGGPQGPVNPVELALAHKKRFSWLSDNKWTRVWRTLTSWVEGPIRYSMALDSIRRGDSIEEAAARIKFVHFDYSELSKFDTKMKMVVPFWVFMSRNFPLQIQMMWKRPRVYNWYSSFVKNFSGEEPEDAMVPLWWREQGAWKLPFGGREAWVAPDLPFIRVFEDLQKAKDPLRLLNDTQPLIQVPVEMIAGRDLFTNRRFTDEPVPVTGALAAALPVLQLLGQVKWVDGKPVTTERAQSAVFDAAPLLQQLRRLFPTDDAYRARVQQSRMSWLGLPYRQLSPQVEEAERKRRRYAAAGR